MRTTTDKLTPELAPLYCRFDRQTNPQDAYVELYRARDGEWTLGADYNSEIGNAVPFDLVNRQLFRWACSPFLRGSEIGAWLQRDDVQALAERIVAGWDDRWSGSDMVGVLTDDAEEADEALEAIFGATLDWTTDDGLVPVYDASDWVIEWDEAVPGADIDELVAKSEATAAAEGAVIEGNLRAAIESVIDRQLVGTAEIARLAGVKVATVQAWTERHETFPEPERTLAMGRVWRWGDVAAWLAIPRKPGRPALRRP